METLIDKQGKYFKERPKIEPKKKTCICGHGYFNHTTTWLLQNGECEECMCPKFKLYGYLTFGERIQLQKSLQERTS